MSIIRAAEKVAEEVVDVAAAGHGGVTAAGHAFSTAGKDAGKAAADAGKSIQSGTKNAGKQLQKIGRPTPKSAPKVKPKTKYYLASRTRPPANRKH